MMIGKQISPQSGSDDIGPVDPLIEAYMRDLVRHTDDPVLVEMERLAQERNFPIVNRLVGIFLYSMVKMINARRVFEFGSGYGYSAYWFAKAMVPDEGMVICSDGNQKNRDLAQQFLTSAVLWDNIDFQVGHAQEIFEQTDGLFDICYNDVDKKDYPTVWLMAKERIRPGGLYIADNVLWHGRVVLKQNSERADSWTEAIREHNRLVFNDADFDAFINPSRDGVIVARRKAV